MRDITVIIPFKETKNKDSVELLKRAIASCGKNHIIVVVPDKDFKESLGKNVKVLFVENVKGYTEPSYLINAAVESCSTEWFALLQFNDTFEDFWFAEFERYADANPATSIFMPLTEAVDTEGKTIGYQNEIAWASSFVNNLGELDVDALNAYYLFTPWGAVINKDNFIKDGELKPSMKISYLYEFLLRSANEGHSIYVIPKAGYKHLINKEKAPVGDMSREETEWWFDLAKKEYYFKNDRNKTFDE